MMNEINSIGWHENNLKNWRLTIDSDEEYLKQQIERLEENKKRLAFFEFQISEAKKEGKKSFDSTRYKVKR
jgi:hypothetical protein